MRKKVLSTIISGIILSLPTPVFALNLEHQYINHNRSHQYLQPQGLVLHDTDNIGATAQNNHDYFNRVEVKASAHYFVDWNKSIQTIPEDEVAWHAGYTANHRFLSLEMCVPRTQEEFIKVYKNTVELVAQICKKHGWTSKEIYSHRYCSYTWHQTDHEDPYAFLQQFGKSWTELLRDIDQKIDDKNISVTPAPIPQHNSIHANATILASTLNVRDKAWGDIIGTVFRNERVEIVRHEGDWYRIKYNTNNGTKTGVAYKQYIRIDTILKTVTASKLNVRDNIWGNIIGAVFNEEKVEVLNSRNGWSYIKYNTSHGSKCGWVYNTYLK